jgi:hypothetical protein
MRLQESCKNVHSVNVTAPLLSFVTTGNENALAAALQKLVSHTWMLYALKDVWRHISDPEQISDEEKRAMRVAVELRVTKLLTEWLKPRLEHAPAAENAALAVYREAFGSGNAASVRCAAAIIESLGDCLEDGYARSNAAGRFVLSLSDEELAEAGAQAMTVFDALGFLCRHVPQRIKSIAGSFLQEGRDNYRRLSDRVCSLLLAHDASALEQIVAEGVARETAQGSQARVLELLAEHFPGKYLQAAREINLAILSHDWSSIPFDHSVKSFGWLVNRYGAEILPDVAEQLSSYKWTPIVIHNLGTLADALGPAATPGMIAALKHADIDVRLEALLRLIGWADPKNDPAIQSGLEIGLAEPDVNVVIKCIGLAGRWRPAAMEPVLWKLFEHKSKPVRQAAARALAKTGAGAVARASELLAAKKAAVRSAAVTLLAIAETPAAANALEARVDDETDEEVRDQILLALEQVWEAQGKRSRGPRSTGEWNAPKTSCNLRSPNG